MVVFEADPDRAQVLIDAGTHVPLSSDSPAPAVLKEPDSLRIFRGRGSPLEAVGALVFLHELTTASGARRIVAIQFLPHYLDGRVLPGAGLVANIYEPGGLLRNPKHVGRSETRLLVPVEEAVAAMKEVRPPLAPDPLMDLASSSARACQGVNSPVLEQAFDPWGTPKPDLRWYAGQPDELDSSHFTIDYEIAGIRGTIDGYLSDDGGHVRMHARPHHAAGYTSGLTRIGYGSLR